jgi:hypothetical protein
LSVFQKLSIILLLSTTPTIPCKTFFFLFIWEFFLFYYFSWKYFAPCHHCKEMKGQSSISFDCCANGAHDIFVASSSSSFLLLFFFVVCARRICDGPSIVNQRDWGRLMRFCVMPSTFRVFLSTRQTTEVQRLVWTACVCVCVWQPHDVNITHENKGAGMSFFF